MGPLLSSNSRVNYLNLHYLPEVHDPHGGHHGDHHSDEEAQGQQPGELEAGAAGCGGGADGLRGGSGRGAAEEVLDSGVEIQDLSEEDTDADRNRGIVIVLWRKCLIRSSRGNDCLQLCHVT